MSGGKPSTSTSGGAPPTDVEKPLLMPWILKQQDSTARLFERNPYYFTVDEAGNQLPYIDQIFMQIVDNKVYNLKIITSEPYAAYTWTTFSNYTLYKENAAANGYVVHELKGPYSSNVRINLLHPTGHTP